MSKGKERNKKILEITDLKDMLNKTREMYSSRIAYKIKIGEKQYRTITHQEIREMIDSLGTALIDLGLKGKRVAVIGENRYEWGLSYLAVACGTGIIVPLDKALPENELEELIERSEVEAIFYSQKYEKSIEKIKLSEKNKLKHLISMDAKTNREGIYSQEELIQKGKKLIENGNREFLDSKIDPNAMNIMLFTSGTTSKSKVVALSHKNICSNLMDIATVLDVDKDDRVLSFLPMHHVFECTTGFLYSLYLGNQMSFCDGIRHILENLNEYKITFACFVPAIYENMYKNITKKLEKEGKLGIIKQLEEKYKDASMEEKKVVFKDLHNIFGGEIKLFVSGAAALDKDVEQGFRNWGINLCQGYGLTETSPVIGVETNTSFRVGSIGKALPSVQVKLEDVNEEGIGELVAKGPNVMIEYYGNEEATKESLIDGWFYTGDLGYIDKDGFLFITGRKKNVIVLKNGKNIYPEEIEQLISNLPYVEENMVFGKEHNDDLLLSVKIVYNKEYVNEKYPNISQEELQEIIWKDIKEINKTFPKYKYIKNLIITDEPMIKTTTQKVKRYEEMKKI